VSLRKTPSKVLKKWLQCGPPARGKEGGREESTQMKPASEKDLKANSNCWRKSAFHPLTAVEGKKEKR